jgi:hypothetical protein
MRHHSCRSGRRMVRRGNQACTRGRRTGIHLLSSLAEDVLAIARDLRLAGSHLDCRTAPLGTPIRINVLTTDGPDSLEISRDAARKLVAELSKFPGTHGTPSGATVIHRGHIGRQPWALTENTVPRRPLPVEDWGSRLWTQRGHFSKSLLDCFRKPLKSWRALLDSNQRPTA